MKRTITWLHPWKKWIISKFPLDLGRDLEAFIIEVIVKHFLVSLFQWICFFNEQMIFSKITQNIETIPCICLVPLYIIIHFINYLLIIFLFCSVVKYWANILMIISPSLRSLKYSHIKWAHSFLKQTLQTSYQTKE